VAAADVAGVVAALAAADGLAAGVAPSEVGAAGVAAAEAAAEAAGEVAAPAVGVGSVVEPPPEQATTISEAIRAIVAFIMRTTLKLPPAKGNTGNPQSLRSRHERVKFGNVEP